MNKKNLQQIFANYIDRFGELNDSAHDETFKWWAAAEFRKRMDEALQADNENFVAILQNIVKDDVVGTIIDGRMQPFNGLVAIASDNHCKLAGDVKQLFLDLLANDNNNLEKREQKIASFLQRSEELRLSTKYSKYYSYKQTARSVSGYLFLYDPAHHYMYKASEAHRFADVIEFYGDWGSGDQINLRAYYKMCDELVAEIENCPELKKTDESRSSIIGRYTSSELANDDSHHILAYDIIFCNYAYDLDRDISFKKLSLAEKKFHEERQRKAQEALSEYLQAEKDYQQLDEAVQHYDSVLVPGTRVWHRVNGTGIIQNRDNGNIAVQFENGEIFKYDPFATVFEGYLKFDDTLDDATAQQYRKLYKERSNTLNMLSIKRHALKEYADILE